MIKRTDKIIESLTDGSRKLADVPLAQLIVSRMRENNPRLVMRVEAELTTCATPTVNLEEDIARMAWKKLPSILKRRVDVKKLQVFLSALDDGSSFNTAVSAADLTPALGADLMVALEKTGLL